MELSRDLKIAISTIECIRTRMEECIEAVPECEIYFRSFLNLLGEDLSILVHNAVLIVDLNAQGLTPEEVRPFLDREEGKAN